MIFEINQVITNFDMVWFGVENDKTIATAIAPFEKGKFTVKIDYPEKESQAIYYNPSDTSHGSSLTDRLTFRVFNKGELIGHIVGKSRKVKGFLQSYAYREMKYMGKDYYLYEVGFGNKGLYLCIYEGDKLIAIADKELTVYDFKDNYTVYSLDKSYTEIIMPLIMHYDATKHGDVMEVAVKSIQRKKVNTIQKELIAKFDPEFIPMIKERDEGAKG